uniref:C2 domain-containing protein n=1 Tax=Romanomermis culicivorax TaxID=13658 RepID=A0A915HL66_ROMCU
MEERQSMVWVRSLTGKLGGRYAGDCEFVVAVGALKGGLRQMQFKGKLRTILTPLIPKPPMIGGVTAFFLDVPTIDFDLTGLGEFVELPLLITTVRNVINTQVSSICVLPNEIVIPLTTETNIVNLYFQEPDGVARINCIEARNLENRDVFLQGKSDPFTRFSVGAQGFRTKTIDNTLNPIWNEIFEAVVDQAFGQKLLVETYDDDVGKNDDFLGRTSIDLGTVKDRGEIDEWYALEGVKHGEIHLSITWLRLTTDMPSLASETSVKQNVNNAILMVYIDNVSNLPSSKLDFEPSPLIEMTVGNVMQATFPKPKTRNPLYRQKFAFFVSNVEHQIFKIEAKDDANAKKTLGECVVPIRELLKENNLQILEQTLYLALGPHSSPLVVSLRLRVTMEINCTSQTVH